MVQHFGAMPEQYETGLLVVMFAGLSNIVSISLKYAIYSPQETVFNFLLS